MVITLKLINFMEYNRLQMGDSNIFKRYTSEVLVWSQNGIVLKLSKFAGRFNIREGYNRFDKYCF